MRALLAGLTGLASVVLLPLSVVSVWTDAVVGDTDWYVATVTPLAEDEAVKVVAATEIERQALRLVQRSHPRLAARDATRRLVHLVVDNAVNGPAFRTAWVQANRIAHEQLLAVLEGDSAALDGGGGVTIDLGAVLDTVTQGLAGQGLVDASQALGIQASVEVMDADQLAKARRVYDALDRLGFWLPVAWAVLVALTLLLARRRLAATAWLALVSLLGMGLLVLGLVWARSALTENLPDPEVARAVWDVLARSLWRAIEVIAVVLGVVALAAGLIGRRAVRRAADPEPST